MHSKRNWNHNSWYFCSDFTNSSDGEERGGPKITELVTTSSANNDTHQDTSSTSEGRILMHQRKRHKIKPHHETLDNSRSSSEEDESDICHRGADISDLNSPDIETDDDSDDEEDASTCYDLSDLPSEVLILFKDISQFHLTLIALKW